MDFIDGGIECSNAAAGDVSVSLLLVFDGRIGCGTADFCIIFSKAGVNDGGRGHCVGFDSSSVLFVYFDGRLTVSNNNTSITS